MRYSIPSFYSIFYGNEFSRYFLRVPQHNNGIRMQSLVETPKNLYIHVAKNNGTYPCYANVYDYGNVDALKRKDISHVIYDRLYFDFDVSNRQAKKLKNKLEELQAKGISCKRNIQQDIQEKLQKMVVDDRIAEKAINQTVDFANKFKESFGNFPLLFFSGFKGAHAYMFFDPIKLDVPKETMSYFAREIKEKLRYDALDLAVTDNAPRRNARVPYSVHPATQLTVVPFDLKDNYEDIMEKSLNHKTTLNESLDIGAYFTNLGEHLKYNIDIPLSKSIKNEKSTPKKNFSYPSKVFSCKDVDHRILFKKILGEPVKEYNDYIKYRCPFKDHNDSDPSFVVYKTAYNCFGCGKKGNYWQFMRDYYGMSDNQIRTHINEFRVK